jgi:hypothetical protein
VKHSTFVILSFFILIANPSFSQVSTLINGKIISEKNEALAGVSVKIEGSDKGVSSDVEGRFTVSSGAAQTVTLIFSAVGYKTKTLASAKPGADEVLVVLETEKKQLEGVTVKASSPRKESVNALISYQKNTSTVSQVISAESIRRSPDKNTGEVLKRVPGTSVQEGKYLVVRGLSDRYNQAMLNGILMNSTEPDRKTFSFDIFPAGMIDNIIINKTFLPELSGEWAGGLVQVNTKDIPANNFLSIQVGTGFNTQTIGHDFYTYRGGKYDWLGLDDGTRGLPTAVPTKQKFREGGQQQMTDYGKLFENVWSSEKTSGNITPLLNSSFQLNGGFNKRLKGNTKLGGVFAVNYNQSVKRTEYNNRFITLQNNVPSLSFDYDNNKYSRDVLWGALANVTLQLGNNNKISFKNLLNVNSSNYVTERTGVDYDQQSDRIKATELALKSNTFFNTQLSGDHNLPTLQSKLHWYGSFSILDQYIPDQRRIQYNQDTAHPNNPYMLLVGASGTSQKSGSRYYGFLSDYIYNAGGDVSTSFKLFDLNQTVKAGYFFQVKDRLFDARPFSIYLPIDNPALRSLPANVVFSRENFGNGIDNKFAFNELPGDRYRYIANTILNAGFIQFDNQFTDAIRATWGVRIEDYDQVLGSMKQSDPRHLHTIVIDVLPGVNLTYKLNNKTNIRVSASQTVIRPEFREVSDFQFFDFDLNATLAGNKALERTKITNIDLRYELYPRAGELITAGVFYKYFRKPIEAYANPGTYNYINADKAQGYGVEFELRKKLDFADALRNFTFQTNLSYIYNRVEDANSNIQRPMQGQSPYVINASLQYDVERYGLTTTLLYNQIGDRILLIGGQDVPPVWEATRPLFDFQIAKKAFKGKGEFKLNVQDLLNQAANFYIDLNDNRKYDTATDALFIKRKYGSNVSLSFAYNLK